MTREERLTDTFVVLADTLVDNYDVIDFLQTLAERSVELLDVSAAGIMLADEESRLRHAACSSEQMRLVELFELQIEQGPCFDAYKTQEPVRCDSPVVAETRWPRFAPHAIAAGFQGVSAVPLRLRSQVVGALNLFSSGASSLDDDDLRVAQAMADVATIGLLQERALRDSRAFSTQLQGALNSRIAIEQAKGIVAEYGQISVDAAFARLRRFARSHNKLLSEVARQVIDGSLPAATLTEGQGSSPEAARGA
ncbi:MAG: GAF and ANTAR domain-containing protein [Acidimicrobiia bacterium]